MSSNIMATRGRDKGVGAVGRLYKARMRADYSAGMESTRAAWGGASWVAAGNEAKQMRVWHWYE